MSFILAKITKIKKVWFIYNQQSKNLTFLRILRSYTIYYKFYHFGSL